jgi:hypothetical protein
MKRAYTKLIPARKLAIRLAYAAVPALGTRSLAELFGTSHQQLYAALGDAMPVGLMEALPSAQISWMADSGKADVADWWPALFSGLTTAFVAVADAVPADQRPRGLMVPADEIEKLVRQHQADPAGAHRAALQTLGKFQASFDQLNRQIGCYRRLAGRRTA